MEARAADILLSQLHVAIDMIVDTQTHHLLLLSSVRHLHTFLIMDKSVSDASTSTSGYTIVVSHAGQLFNVALSASSTLAELQAKLYELTRVTPSSQKIIYQGKTLSSASTDAANTPMNALGLKDQSKLRMIGTREETVSAFVREGQDLQKRYTVSSSRQTVKPRSTPSHGKSVMDLNDLRKSGANAFATIETLPGCPHEDSRRDRLRKLSTDEAVLGKLNNHAIYDRYDPRALTSILHIRHFDQNA